MKDIKEKVRDKNPKIRNPASRLPKELVRSAMLETKEKSRMVADKVGRETGEESPVEYAGNRIERAEQRAGKESASVAYHGGKKLAVKTYEKIKEQRQREAVIATLDSETGSGGTSGQTRTKKGRTGAGRSIKIKPEAEKTVKEAGNRTVKTAPRMVKASPVSSQKVKTQAILQSTQMKATGEVMSIGRTFEESLLKAIRSLETGVFHLYMEKFDEKTREELLSYIKAGTDDRIFAVAQLLRLGCNVQQIAFETKIDGFFLEKMKKIIEMENMLKANPWNRDVLHEAKRGGFSDRAVAWLWNTDEDTVFRIRKEMHLFPVYKMIDTCASEFDSYVPYFYSTYEEENESIAEDRKKILVLGSGPIRIGQGVEFDYSTVHAVKTIRNAGYEAIVINNNPETVSTDYTTSDKLYFEPLCVEDVMNVIELERPDGVIASLGGQTAVNLAEPLESRGVTIIGTDCEAIEKAENRESFEKLLAALSIPQPKGQAVTNIEDGVKAAAAIGYPVLVRPSFVLGGRAMQIVAKEEQLRQYLKTAVEINEEKPVLVDHYIRGKELEIDGICDGQDVFVPGIMELVERTGVHSGDSISVYPSYSISDHVKEVILDYTRRLGLGIGIRGLFNIQFIVDQEENVYIIEVNPRSSRTVPFLSKATGYSLADIATRVILGISLKEQGIDTCYPEEKSFWYVKAPAFSFAKLNGMDAYLSPEMKSTGEAIGYDRKFPRAMYKALIASGVKMQNYGTVMVTLADEDKEEALPLIRRFYEMGFNIEATVGTGEFLKAHGIRTRIRRKLSENSTEILEAIRSGYVSYVINTRAILSGVHYEDGLAIRRTAIENNVTMFTSLDTVKVLLDVLEEITIGVSPLYA